MPQIIYKGVPYSLSQIVAVIAHIRTNGSRLTTIYIIELLTKTPYTTSSTSENINFGKFLSTHKDLLGIHFDNEIPYLLSCGKQTTTALWK